MKNMIKKVAVGMTMVMALGVFTGCGSEKKEADKVASIPKVGIIQLVEHQALDSANKGFVDAMKKRGFVDGETVKYDQQNAQADQSNLQNISQRFVNDKVDLICAIATPAAQSVANATTTIPIVGTAITDYKVAKLVKSAEKPGTNVTGTTDMNPVDRQLDLLLSFVPNAKKIGTIYNSSEVNSQIQVELLKKFAKAKGIEVKEATVSTVNDIQQAGQSLVADKVDAIYVPTDNVVASAMPVLASITNEAKLVVICGEAAVVQNGALATVGIDYYKLGLQTGDMAADILEKKSKPEDMAIQSLKDMTYTVNERVAKEIGVTVPKDILAKAEIVK
jgi:putative ABC transport system substrate-binding protein